VSEHHPWVREFAHALARPDDPGATSRARAFARIVEAFGDERGLPTLAGLRRVEAGHLDDRLSPEWKPVVLDVYRRWIGFRFDRELSREPRTLALEWWLQPPRRLLGRVPDTVRVLLSPLLVAALVLAAAVVAAAPVLARAHHRAGELASASAAVRDALDSESSARARLEARAVLGDDADLPDLPAAHAAWRASLEELRRVRRRAEAAEGQPTPP